MSRDYTVQFNILHPLTQEIVFNILKNMQEISGIFESKSFEAAFVQLLKEGYIECSWDEDDPQDPMAAYPLVWISAWKLNDNSFRFRFSPSGGNRWGRSYAPLGIDFKWYIEKALKVLEPLPIAGLTAEAGQTFTKDAPEWRILVFLNELDWPSGPPYFENLSEFPEYRWEYMKTGFDRLIENAKSAGCIFESLILDETTLTQDALILKGKMSWGDEIIAKIQFSRFQITQADREYRPSNLRPYLEFLTILWKEFTIDGLQADSLALRNEDVIY